MPCNPNEPPFWEKEVGGGPVTDWMRDRERIAGLQEITNEIDWLESQHTLVNGNARYLQRLYSARRALLAEMGRTRYIELGDFQMTGYARMVTRCTSYEPVTETTETPYSVDWGNTSTAIRADGHLGDGNKRYGVAQGSRRVK